MSEANRSNRTEVTDASSFSEEDLIPRDPHVGESSEECLDLIEEDERDSFSWSSTESSLYGSEESEWLPEGMPSEIVVFEDSVTESDEMLDTHKRLKVAESLVESYKAKMQSTENLTESLNRYLRKTQDVAEDLLAERNGLLGAIKEMEQEEASSNEQGSLLKMIICFSLFVYMCGGSEFYLVASVGFFLFADLISTCCI
jgi:hypothetical protein